MNWWRQSTNPVTSTTVKVHPISVFISHFSFTPVFFFSFNKRTTSPFGLITWITIGADSLRMVSQPPWKGRKKREIGGTLLDHMRCITEGFPRGTFPRNKWNSGQGTTLPTHDQTDECVRILLSFPNEISPLFCGIPFQNLLEFFRSDFGEMRSLSLSLSLAILCVHRTRTSPLSLPTLRKVHLEGEGMWEWVLNQRWLAPTCDIFQQCFGTQTDQSEPTSKNSGSLRERVRERLNSPQLLSITFSIFAHLCADDNCRK